jgi:predicted CxxxxCH...CXXCH cytochrome family protein
VAGAHGPHDALPNVTGVCDTCHDGAGLTTNRHNNGTADVAILPTYNAKTGTAAYDATNNRCSEVSCHGGLVTPNWATGTIDVNADCTSCHTAGTAPATPEYNSYFSGEHAFHFSFMQSCTTFCHDTTKLRVNHFTTLNTTAMEGPASGTLNDALQYNGVSCNPSAGGLVGCHGQRNWQ